MVLPPYRQEALSQNTIPREIYNGGNTRGEEASSLLLASASVEGSGFAWQTRTQMHKARLAKLSRPCSEQRNRNLVVRCELNHSPMRAHPVPSRIRPNRQVPFVHKAFMLVHTGLLGPIHVCAARIAVRNPPPHSSHSVISQLRTSSDRGVGNAAPTPPPQSSWRMAHHPVRKCAAG